MKRIILHIGRPKTGSTALQTFFRENSDQLKALGVYYPEARPHSTPFWEKGLTAYGEEIGDILRRYKQAKNSRDAAKMSAAEADLIDSWSVVRADFDESACDRILISYEGLAGGDPKLLRSLFADDQVMVVCYLRRQDEIFQSTYIQKVRSPLARFTGSIYKLMKQQSLINRLDYLKMLMVWSNAFGLDNMVVRVYDKKNLSGGIVQDFLKAVGITFSETPKEPEKIANPSFDHRAVALLRCLNWIPMSRKMHMLTQRKITLFFARPLHQPHVLLNAEEKRQFMERFEESNQAVARRYLGREDGVLFPDS